MEKKGYRENLELLAGAFPGQGALHTKQFAAFCGVSAATVRRWVDAGELAAVQGKGERKMIVIPVQSAARFLAG